MVPTSDPLNLGEHVWPKSHADLNTKTPGPGTDLHNLHAADISVNAERGNKEGRRGRLGLHGQKWWLWVLNHSFGFIWRRILTEMPWPKVDHLPPGICDMVGSSPAWRQKSAYHWGRNELQSELPSTNQQWESMWPMTKMINCVGYHEFINGHGRCTLILLAMFGMAAEAKQTRQDHGRSILWGFYESFRFTAYLEDYINPLMSGITPVGRLFNHG